MKHFILLFLALIQASMFGQCNFPTSPTDIFYPNSTYGYSSNVPQLLCGPNTIVWDTTSQSNGCINVMCNPSTTLNLKTPFPCTLVSFGTSVYLKNGAVLNVLKGSSSTRVHFEAGAVINDPFGLVTYTYQCASITFPVTDCVAGIKEFERQSNIFLAWPNPSDRAFNLKFLMQYSSTVDLTIYDQVGKIVFYKSSWPTSDNELSTGFLDSGSYFLSIKTSNGQQTQKILIFK